jgi:cyclic beta-1,2-glucan synthetase
MTAATNFPKEAPVSLPTDALGADARAVASIQSDVERAPRWVTHFSKPPFASSLEHARQYLQAGPFVGDALPKAAAWFLDNYYLLRRASRQVAEELPRGFVCHLPQLASGPAKGRPRIEALSRAVVALSGIALDLPLLRDYLDAYQEVTPLTIAELWALPTILRATVLEHLLQFLGLLGVPGLELARGGSRLHREGSGPHERTSTAVAPTLGVERAIRALRLLDAIDWKVFFSATSRVEAILRTDPSLVYGRMDFVTRDSYRKVVEAVAWATGRSETDVADLAVEFARGGEKDERRGHVGYYLVAEGRSALENRLGYRPKGLERVQRLVTHWPTSAYLWPLAVLTAVPLLTLAWCVAHGAGYSRGTLAWVVAAAVLAVLPLSAVSVAIVTFAFARLLPPRTLPKLDFEAGVPTEARTLVVIPTLLGRVEDVTSMLRRLEVHYLSNPDPQLQFALLTDDVDAKALVNPSDEASLLAQVANGISDLNTRHSRERPGPFHLLHRSPRWNPAEERFMGWERKRGKLDELNRLLRGDTTTSYSCHIGDAGGLLGIRFVITLDSDTELPMGSAHRLVGLLSHPLNRAVFNAATGRVVAGYTIAQPRIETSPASARGTPFSRMFAGRLGLDIYTHACSEIYQDLFGSGIYVGKGIYDIDAFARSVGGVAPENALVSHDLFEGIHGRTALATDVVLFESYPANYATYSLRMHRWVRGDWQLVPWLFSRVPTAGEAKSRNRLSMIDRWKIVDNLRRSARSPLLFALLVLCWACLPGSAAFWTLGTLAILLAPLLPAVASGRRIRLEALGRCVLAVAFLAYEAAVVLDAIVLVLVRKKITGKHLLQWTSAAHAAAGVASRSPRSMFWQTMIASPLLAVASGLLLAWARPSAWVVATPILTMWFLAPEVAQWISRPRHRRAEDVTDVERKTLRMLARRTWRFFETFVGPKDHWLPVDNYQEEPHEMTAHRTSPTNIGLGLLATLSAYDFGYVGPRQLSIVGRGAFDSIGRMSHYRGHLFNWYDTRSLRPLVPHYVSTVDSGNLAGCLLAFKQGCREAVAAHVVRVETWDGIRDSIDAVADVVASMPSGTAESVRGLIQGMQRASDHAREHLEDSYPTVRVLCDETACELEREVLKFLESGARRYEARLLRALRTSIDTLHQQLQQTQQELDALLPWLSMRDEAAAHGCELPWKIGLGEIPVICRRVRGELDAKERERRGRALASPELDASALRLDGAFQSGERNAVALAAELASLAERAGEEVAGMDFKLLYDGERKLFFIGYNASSDQADANHYDLLASEARLASYVGIVKRDVPEDHWYALGRPMTQMRGDPMLLSWGGTMFEYLMPSLLMKSQDGTLLARTNALATDAQIAYARKSGEPWGISESAYARLDANETYQYRSFGVPGLGLKRGLEDDRVVTPYASLLALSLRPREVVANLGALEAMGMLGTYGLFEALDLTPGRAVEHPVRGPPFAVVRSYMAHHQGMLLVALGNFLNRRTMVERFHSDALVETGEALLNEWAPDTAPAESLVLESAKHATVGETAGMGRAPAPWSPADRTAPHAFVLSNERLTSLVTGSGGGGLRWKGLDLTRYEPDATHDDDGIWVYLRDEESGLVWRATSTAGETTYAMHKAEFHLRQQGISARVEVAVAAADDVEVRMITLHNETSRLRRLTVTSAGRPVLFDATQAPTHPVFSSMFVESERVGDLDALLFARRPQAPEEKPVVLVHGLVREGAEVTFAGYETDRGAFLGRGADSKVPVRLVTEKEGLHGSVGAVLDPVMSLMARIELMPLGSVTLALVTTVARSRDAAVALARKYGSMHAVRWAFRDAEQECPRRLARTKVEPALLPTVQRLFSAVLFDDPTVRPSASARAAAHPNQHRLWGRGISGDQPIVLVDVGDPGAPLLRETLAAQRYLRSCGVALDIVLVDEHASEYASDGAETLRSVLSRNDVDEWLGRHGGVFVLAADQVPEAELRHLKACARVFLNTRDDSLASRLARVAEGPPMLPAFEATLVDESAERDRPRPKLLLDNGIGGFTEDGREYVLEVGREHSTPAPWCNVLANPDFGCLVSESALGATWSLNSGENRLTPWRNDPVLDTPSEALYLRDEETAAVWSPTPLPAGKGAKTLVRHGAGYTVYERESHGLVQEMTVFVPRNASLKVVRLRVKNTLTRHRRLTATYYAEWVLGSRRKRQTPYIVSSFDRERSCLLATCDWITEFAGRVAFVASKNGAHGFTTNRTEFIGRRGDLAAPEGLERWGLSDRADLGADPCAALQVHLELAPGEELETHFVLGQSANREEALKLVERFRESDVVEAAWSGLRAYWDRILGNIRVKTPELSMDLMLNRWLIYQVLSSRVFGRTGFYQSSGAFGFRDQLQDVMALLHAAPEVARAQILSAAERQFEEGDVLHWWHPPSGRGVRTRCSDDMAWLPYVTAEYVTATGDMSVLEEQVPFLQGAPLKVDEHNRYAEYEASGPRARRYHWSPRTSLDGGRRLERRNEPHRLRRTRRERLARLVPLRDDGSVCFALDTQNRRRRSFALASPGRGAPRDRQRRRLGRRLVSARVSRRRFARGFRDEPRVPNRLHPTVVGGSVRARERRLRRSSPRSLRRRRRGARPRRRSARAPLLAAVR